jgi:acetolactate decarboxylase
MKKIIIHLVFGFLILLMGFAKAQETSDNVTIVGEMKNVMWKGELFGRIHLDTMSNRKNLFGLGPVEYLTGEILIMDGRSYRSTVTSDSTMKVEETYHISAPFFGYTHVSQWVEHTLSKKIRSIKDLEAYLNSATIDKPRPFMFKLSGVIDQATIHIVNLPLGTTVRSPDEAHQGLKKFQLQNEQVDILGFFSTEHKAVFTHHDTFVHMHLMTKDQSKMGHLDDVLFKRGAMKLELPWH